MKPKHQIDSIYINVEYHTHLSFHLIYQSHSLENIFAVETPDILQFFDQIFVVVELQVGLEDPIMALGGSIRNLCLEDLVLEGKVVE